MVTPTPLLPPPSHHHHQNAHILQHPLASCHVAMDASVHWLSCLKKKGKKKRETLIGLFTRGWEECRGRGGRRSRKRNKLLNSSSSQPPLHLFHPPTPRSLTLKTLVVFSSLTTVTMKCTESRSLPFKPPVWRGLASYKSFSGDLTMFPSPSSCSIKMTLDRERYRRGGGRLNRGDEKFCIGSLEDGFFQSFSNCLFPLMSGKQVQPLNDWKETKYSSQRTSKLFCPPSRSILSWIQNTTQHTDCAKPIYALFRPVFT